MENVMGTKPVNRLILTTSVPLMLSLLINSLYNFVDSIFISRISEEALTALSLASPIQMLTGALGTGVAVGLNAVISKALGEKNEQKVMDAASASLWLAFFSWILLLICGIVIPKPYFAWQSKGNEEIIYHGTRYLSIVLIASLGQMGQWVFDRFPIASGKSNLFIFTLSAASVTNLILDPILIFGYFGLPALGASGAALATVIGQAVGCISGYFINRRWNKEIPIHFTLHPKFEYMKEMLIVGIPSSIVQSLTSLIGVFMNALLSSISMTAVTVYGICSRVQGPALVPVWGFYNGLIPLVAYNYGAKKPDRIRDCIRWAYRYSFVIMLIIGLFLEVFPDVVLRLFDASDELMTVGIPALRILTGAWLISIVPLILAAVFQGYGLGTSSMIVNLGRQIVFIFLFGTILKPLGLPYIWFAFVLAEACSIPIALLLYRRQSAKT